MPEQGLTRDVLEQVILESGDRMLPYFRFGHLPAALQTVIEPFAALALILVRNQRSTAERTVALRKLLESKDCAVRNALEP